MNPTHSDGQVMVWHEGDGPWVVIDWHGSTTGPRVGVAGGMGLSPVQLSWLTDALLAARRVLAGRVGADVDQLALDGAA